MKNTILFSIILFILACKEPITPPQNLMDKDSVAEVIAELVITEQISFTNSKINLESQTKYLFKKSNIKSKDFVASYQYYLAKGKMNSIIEKAQEIIKSKDAKAEEYIDGQIKYNPKGRELPK